MLQADSIGNAIILCIIIKLHGTIDSLHCSSYDVYARMPIKKLNNASKARYREREHAHAHAHARLRLNRYIQLPETKMIHLRILRIGN